LFAQLKLIDSDELLQLMVRFGLMVWQIIQYKRFASTVDFILALNPPDQVTRF
jgi:hypothetical protein